MFTYDRRKSVEAKASASLAPDISATKNIGGPLSHTVLKASNPFSMTKEPYVTHGPEVNPEDQSPKLCDDCEKQASLIWNCAYCGMNFCDRCWDQQAQHRRGRTGPDGLPHEKANPSIVRKFKDILTPPQDRLAQQALHREDEDTTWFGLAKDKDNKPVLQDYGRYTAIMGDSNTGNYQARYPQIVSFVGQTGAGKSTLIRMLIEQQESAQGTPGRKFPSPVVGSLAHGNVPTSGDVHLYSDPSTYGTEYPILLADCEGLEGGENIPISEQYRTTTIEKTGKDKDSKLKKRVSNGMNYTPRVLKWANGAEKKKREYAVTQLYPRLLYTFSDVVVFVLRNPKYV
jgi:energy-coupling factor transporter ATP-binding protein EcfA2